VPALTNESPLIVSVPVVPLAPPPVRTTQNQLPVVMLPPVILTVPTPLSALPTYTLPFTLTEVPALTFNVPLVVSVSIPSLPMQMLPSTCMVTASPGVVGVVKVNVAVPELWPRYMAPVAWK